MPDSQEISRRIKAARELRQVSQVELNEKFREDGLDKTAAGRIERCEVTMLRAHRDAFVRHLRVPERWFTAETVDEIVGHADLGDLVGALDDLQQLRDDVARLVELLEERPGPLEPRTAEEMVDVMRLLARQQEQLLNQQGRHIGRRDLQRQSDRIRPPVEGVA